MRKFKSHSFTDFYGPNQPQGNKIQGSLRYFIRLCCGGRKCRVQWTGHLGCADRASDIHNIFPSEVTQPKYHPITSHLVPNIPYKTYNSNVSSSQVFGRNVNRAFGVRSQKGYRVRVLFFTTSSGKILGLYPGKTFYKPEFNIFREKMKNYGTTLILYTKQVSQGIWGAGSVPLRTLSVSPT